MGLEPLPQRLRPLTCGWFGERRHARWWRRHAGSEQLTKHPLPTQDGTRSPRIGGTRQNCGRGEHATATTIREQDFFPPVRPSLGWRRQTVMGCQPGVHWSDWSVYDLQ